MYTLEKVVNGRWEVIDVFISKEYAVREATILETIEHAIVRVGDGSKFVYITEKV